ncbi:MAG: hypothetical protein O2780_01040 [Proteobacteria bacterium]|nr:hypothetical protein [Pseudomonadota bacterium]MDA1300397.1 hypothetical protein [Pseudomonadota bacterium]
MTRHLRFYLSHVQVDLHCADPRVLLGLEAVWGGANQPLVETRKRVELIVDVAGARVLCDGEPLVAGEDLRSLLSSVEYSIYQLLHQWHREYTLVHGALVCRGDRTLLLVGPSGSGKSSLALAALRQGWGYLSDEIAVTNGSEVWGIRRAIQFDSMPTTSELPPFLQGVDTSAYQWQEPDGMTWCLPLQSVPADACSAAPVADVRVVFIVPDHAGKPRRLDGIDALVRLHEACFDRPRHDLGRLAGMAWTLSWDQPESAARQLAKLCETT